MRRHKTIVRPVAPSTNRNDNPPVVAPRDQAAQTDTPPAP